MEISSVNYANIAMQMKSVHQPKPQGEVIRSNDLSDMQKEIKDQTLALKSDNDLFGALKTVEKSLIALKAIVESAESGELDKDEAVVALNERMEISRYKNENLYANFPLADGSTIDIREKLIVSNPSDLDSFKGALQIAIKDSSESLTEVKTRIMGGTKAMGENAQKSFEKSSSGVINPADIMANTNVDYLKDQFAKLLR